MFPLYYLHISLNWEKKSIPGFSLLIATVDIYINLEGEAGKARLTMNNTQKKEEGDEEKEDKLHKVKGRDTIAYEDFFIFAVGCCEKKSLLPFTFN